MALRGGEEADSFEVMVGRRRGGETRAPMEVLGDILVAGVSWSDGSLFICMAGEDIDPADNEGVINDVHPPPEVRPLVRDCGWVVVGDELEGEATVSRSTPFLRPKPVRLASLRRPVGVWRASSAVRGGVEDASTDGLDADSFSFPLSLLVRTLSLSFDLSSFLSLDDARERPRPATNPVSFATTAISLLFTLDLVVAVLIVSPSEERNILKDFTGAAA